MEATTIKQGLTTFHKEIDITPFDQMYVTIQAGSKEGQDFGSTISLLESNELLSLTKSMQDNIYHLLNKSFLEQSFSRFMEIEGATIASYMGIIFSYLVSIEENCSIEEKVIPASLN